MFYSFLWSFSTYLRLQSSHFEHFCWMPKHQFIVEQFLNKNKKLGGLWLMWGVKTVPLRGTNIWTQNVKVVLKVSRGLRLMSLVLNKLGLSPELNFISRFLRKG